MPPRNITARDGILYVNIAPEEGKLYRSIQDSIDAIQYGIQAITSFIGTINVETSEASSTKPISWENIFYGEK